MVKRSIPVAIGYHSGLDGYPDAMLEVVNEERLNGLLACLNDDIEFKVSVSAMRKEDGSLKVMEIRFVPDQAYNSNKGRP